jgi:hypothetical protein
MLETIPLSIQTWPSEQFMLLLALALLTAIAAAWMLRRSHRHYRFIEDTPTARIRSAPQGYVELEGQGELLAGEPIISPLSARHCLWFRYQIDQRETTYDSRGQKRESWRRIEGGISRHLFGLNDGTGLCIIDPDGADVTPDQRQRWYGHSLYDRRPPLKRRHWLAQPQRYRFSEQLILPESHLYAIGEFATLHSHEAESEPEEEMRRLLSEWKRDRAALMARFDRNGDGVIDQEEWQAARDAARTEATRQASTMPTSAINMLRQPASRQPFLISTLDQAALVRRLKWQSIGWLLLLVVALLSAILMWQIRHTPLAGELSLEVDCQPAICGIIFPPYQPVERLAG